MAVHADDFQTLHIYAEGVMNRATHHAGNVSAVALALLGGVIWRARPGSVQIKEYGGDLANILWWESLNGNRYACAYNHGTQEIEVRDRSVRGVVLHRFSNSTPITDIERVHKGFFHAGKTSPIHCTRVAVSLNISESNHNFRSIAPTLIS